MLYGRPEIDPQLKKEAFAVKDSKVDPMELVAYYEDYMRRNSLPANSGEFKRNAEMNQDGVPMNMPPLNFPNYNQPQGYEQKPMVGLPQPIPYDHNQFQQQPYGAPQQQP